MSVPHLRFEKLRTGPKSEGKPDFQPRTRDIERLPRTTHYSMQLNSMETFYGSKLITTLVTRHVHTPSRCWKNKERALKVSEKLIFGPRIRTGVGEVTHWGSCSARASSIDLWFLEAMRVLKIGPLWSAHDFSRRADDLPWSNTHEYVTLNG